MITPRPYQTEAVSACLRERENGLTRGLVSLPTGCGKTPLAALLINELGAETLFLAHRQELISQAVDKISLVVPRSDIGILQAKEADGIDAKICVASVQTVAQKRRLDELKRRDFRLAIVDECHHAIKNSSYWRILSELGFMGGDPGRLLVGLSATPFRLDGKPLGEFFERVVFERSILAMMKGGYLCDARGIRISTEADLSSVHTEMGDLAINELSIAVDTPERNNLVAESYLKHAHGRRAVAFCVDVQHSHNLADAFNDAGIRAKAVWGAMDKDDRRETLSGFASHELDVLTNCNVLTEGFDDPGISAILLARPTKSQALYTQMCGRGFRLHPGKPDCLILDFVDMAGRHKLCKFADLAGDPRISAGDGESLLEAASRAEEAVKSRARGCASISVYGSGEIDLFGRSDLVWTPVDGGHYRIAVDDSRNVWVRKVDGGYTVWLADKHGSAKSALSNSILDLGYAQGIAEDYVRANAPRCLVSKEATWRRDGASEKQIGLLRQWKIPYSPGISKGEACALIDLEMARREAAKMEPATAKQMWFIHNRIGVNVADSLTKGEASRIISEAKSRVA
ncbi:MAG: DEAD/DEAH box helicase [Synergistaceae bacterium]|jgi:superfamily II DNA or RNA helicase|nr:DEAD/DEAH box helicase [Synergistaceae bacterium]